MIMSKIRVGLTGGIASGKSTVGKILREIGAAVIDTDAVARDVVLPGTEALAEISRRYGKTILNSAKRLRRDKLAEIVFANPEEKSWLEQLLHPLIRKSIEEQADKAFETGCRVVFFEVPLLFEVGWDKNVDSVWLVYVPPAVQSERLVKRDSLTDEEVELRLRSQWPIDEKARLSDVIIDNTGSRLQTRKQVKKAWLELLDRLDEGQDRERNNH